MSAMDESRHAFPIRQGFRTRRQPGLWFPIEMDIHYIYRANRAVVEGDGKTVGISSREVCFKSSDSFDQGQKIELALKWPASLDGSAQLKLMILGWVSGTELGLTIAKIERHQFLVGKFA